MTWQLHNVNKTLLRDFISFSYKLISSTYICTYVIGQTRFQAKLQFDDGDEPWFIQSMLGYTSSAQDKYKVFTLGLITSLV